MYVNFAKLVPIMLLSYVNFDRSIKNNKRVNFAKLGRVEFANSERVNFARSGRFNPSDTVY